MEPSQALVTAIAKDPEVQAVWDTLNKQNRYAFCHRLARLKTEAGRQKRIIATVEQLRKGELPYPQKVKEIKMPSSTAVRASPARGEYSGISKGTRRSSRRA